MNRLQRCAVAFMVFGAAVSGSGATELDPSDVEVGIDLAVVLEQENPRTLHGPFSSAANPSADGWPRTSLRPAMSATP